jgi:hypothetical protein
MAAERHWTASQTRDTPQTHPILQRLLGLAIVRDEGPDRHQIPASQHTPY